MTVDPGTGRDDGADRCDERRGRIGVRFYRKDDSPAAAYIAAQIAQTLDQPVATQDLSARPNAASAKAGLVEVWFPVAAS